ncbi:MAG: secondary thiamine-phosphate synthase enzyme YjbQ [Candidatus Parcubacteria bacterium]|nr:secondary thiamine-phosphate synthase enzyme YjbQ [Candidatus Parcubacteria bacterium]
MKVTYNTISLQTKGKLDIIDITKDVKDCIAQAEVKDGIINIQTMHTTAAVFVNENEPELLKDFKKHLNNIAPEAEKYCHDNFEIRTVNICEDECQNGHSHCKALHLPTNICLNIINNNLQLGKWQSILFIELDHARKRQIQLQIIGE